MRAKLGLVSEDEADLNLATGFLTAMEGKKVDYTLAFRYLADAALGREEPIRALFADPSAYDALERTLAGAACARGGGAFGACAGDAACQSGVHSAQPSSRGSLERCSGTRRLRAFRDAAEYPIAPFRRSAGVCRLCRTSSRKGKVITEPSEVPESRVRATQNFHQLRKQENFLLAAIKIAVDHA